MKKLLFTVLALASLLVAATAAAAPAPNAGSNSNSDRGRMLVGFDRAPTASDRAAIALLGGVVRRDFSEIGALAVEISSARVGQLARLGGVSYVEQDELRYPMGLAADQLTPSLSNGLYGLLTTKATTAHSRDWTGEGIKACVADTGLDYEHPDIAGNYKGGIDTVANDNNPSYQNAGLEDETHGTHVAGTLLAAADDTQGVFGVAYNSDLYHARVMTNTGGYSSDIMEGVRHLVKVFGCKVVNMSLGGGIKSRTEERFYKEMRREGALIVAAAGNNGQTKLSYPAGYAVNISVAAVDRNNVLASFSNTGRGLDVSAPGVMVLSSVPANRGWEASVTTSSTVTAYGLEFAGTTSGTSGELVDCGLAEAASDCRRPAGAGPFVALIQRGEIRFADKVTNATTAGAIAVIIYNNASGEFTGTLGAAGAWIPAVSVSGTVGALLKTEVGSDATVVNQISSWDHYSGTSMATPHVTGVVALIWSTNPSLTNAAVEKRLFSTATDLGAAGYDTTFGYGLVNADAATAP